MDEEGHQRLDERDEYAQILGQLMIVSAETEHIVLELLNAHSVKPQLKLGPFESETKNAIKLIRGSGLKDSLIVNLIGNLKEAIQLAKNRNVFAHNPPRSSLERLFALPPDVEPFPDDHDWTEVKLLDDLLPPPEEPYRPFFPILEVNSPYKNEPQTIEDLRKALEIAVELNNRLVGAACRYLDEIEDIGPSIKPLEKPSIIQKRGTD